MPRPRSGTVNDEPSVAVQYFREECDINNIVRQYTETGVIGHMRNGTPQYGDAPDLNYYESLCIAAEAASAFELDPTLGEVPVKAESASEALSGALEPELASSDVPPEDSPNSIEGT